MKNSGTWEEWSEDNPLLYVGLLCHKGEAARAIIDILAEVNNSFGCTASQVVFRLHSDRGGEFMSEELFRWCAERQIHPTITQAHDRNTLGVVQQDPS